MKKIGIMIFILVIGLSGLFANGSFEDNRTMEDLIEHFSRYHTITEKEQNGYSYNIKLDGFPVTLERHELFNMWHDTYSNPFVFLYMAYIYSNGLFSMSLARLDTMLYLIKNSEDIEQTETTQEEIDYAIDYMMTLLNPEVRKRITETFMRF